MRSMRDRVSKLQNAAAGRNGRTYAAAVALIVAFFALLTWSQQGDSQSISTVPRRFLFSAGLLQETGSDRGDGSCDSLPPGAACYANAKVWAPVLASISQCLLKRPLVYVQDNIRLKCDQMRTVDPPIVQVDQSHCYPDEYFTTISTAGYLLERYPINLRPKSTDLDVLQQFYCEPNFLYTRFMGPYLPIGRPAVVVDAGANIGLASMLYAQVINFWGEIYAIEANPSTLKVLEANVALLGGLVTPVGAALVNEETAASGANITFSGSPDQFWGFHVIHGDDPGEQYTTFDVPTRSLSQIKAMTKSGVIDFIKVDIEGEEKQLFEDRASWPALCEIRCIAAEIHGWIEGAREALTGFLQDGCIEDPFKHITTTGEYELYCRPSVIHSRHNRARALAESS